MYCLYENDGKKYTQKEFCDEWSYSRQTVNSTLKKLEKEGVVTLQTAEDKKSEYVILTEKGRKTAQKIILPLMECEISSFKQLNEDEIEIFLGVMRKYSSHFSKAIGEFLQKNKGDCEK